jgi:hypothetical protein
VRTEVTDRMLIFGERHLHRVLARYAAHYNTGRPPRPDITGSRAGSGQDPGRPILGSLLNEYEIAA